MTDWARGKRGSALVFATIVLLVVGGLGWLTTQALDMERSRDQAQRRIRQAEERAQREQELTHRLQLALTLLDSRVLPTLVQEETRPFSHYSAVFASSGSLTSVAGKWKPDTVLAPSPLLVSELPDWIVLHFQSAGGVSWGSPELPSERLRKRLTSLGIEIPAMEPEHNQERAEVLAELNRYVRPSELLALVEEKSVWLESEEKALLPGSPGNDPSGASNLAANNQPQGHGQTGKIGPPEENRPPDQKSNTQQPQNFDQRFGQYARVQGEQLKNVQEKADPAAVARNLRNEEWFAQGAMLPRAGTSVSVLRGRMVRFWLPTAEGQERLVIARRVRVGETVICQGLLLDWPRLERILQTEVADLFPNARFLPLHSDQPPQPERSMSALPIMLDPAVEDRDGTAGEEPAASAGPILGWSTLHVGLALTWAAALVALAAVGLAGRSLLNLSERRIRFVSAVTHELRTPLTTLRLYLDMLTGGMVKDERTKEEYLRTLDSEAERLSRLIDNVLDFSRLENKEPTLNRTAFTVGELLDQIQQAWERRCQDSRKELVVEHLVGAECVLESDAALLQQVLGNLIDNACKYSRDAEDNRIWLRSSLTESGRLALEVEDRGPGVATGEQRAIFHPFRRGEKADVTAGGVGLGLALARRWTRLLGGTLSLVDGGKGTGACFRLEMPVAVHSGR